MTTKPTARTAAAAAVLAIAAAFAVGCSHAKQAGSAVSGAAGAGARAGAPYGAASGTSEAVSGPPALVGSPTTMNVPGVGNVTLDAATAVKYDQLGDEAVLGPPTSQPEKVGDGTAQAFAKGTIYSSPSTDAYLVRGEILRVYLAQGGPTGALGFPTNDEYQIAGGPDFVKGGWRSDFQNGSISWINQGDAVFKATVTQQ